MKQKRQIVIIGGGAAGLMAACAASGLHDVTVVERNASPGVKLNITGKGRCNVTNDCDVPTLVARTPGNGRFLFGAFSAFPPRDVMVFFERAGVPLVTERGNRVFPASQRAKDVTGALVRTAKAQGVRFVKARATGIRVRDGRACAVETENGAIDADRVVLATGGLSYPRTGSSGDGHAIAHALGHTIVRTRPSLVPLVARGNDPARLEGLSLRNVALTVTRDGREIFRDFGEMLFTANGVSGPLVLSASAHLAHAGGFDCAISIDLKPALDEAALDKRILRDFGEQANRDFSNALYKLLPAKLVPVVVARSTIPPDGKVNAVTRAQRDALCRLIKHFSLDITAAASYHEAVVTAGGVATKEINPKTLESKIVKGLYFAGEIIDVDAYTGGFNLQIAWSTGHAAGTACAAAPDRPGGE